MKKFFFLAAMLCVAGLQAGTPGALSGRFTINNKGEQVVFSQGNLQYVTEAHKWQFAEHQWDCLGTDNMNQAIDLFGWGTGDLPGQVSTDTTDYRVFTDWGANPISNGGQQANLWRTLSKEEWAYLLNNHRQGQATVAGVHGLVLLPNDCSVPSGMTFTNQPNNWTTNTYADDEWVRMENVGAVFFPAAGEREGSSVTEVGYRGSYWSSTRQDSEYAGQMYFDDGYVNGDNYYYCYFGQSVRLVLDFLPNEFTGHHMNGIFTVANGKRVQFATGNLQYVPATGKWQFADQQWDFVGEDNQYIDNPVYQGAIDLFGWGTGDVPTVYSTDNDDYLLFNDWVGPAADSMGLEGNWRTMSYADMNKLIAERDNAYQLFAKGKVMGINGMILLPDNWDIANHPLDYAVNNYTTYVFNAREWHEWEAKGAVFLPAAGDRVGTTVSNLNTEGSYWTSSSASSGYEAWMIYIACEEYWTPDAIDGRAAGASVRLMKEYVEPTPTGLKGERLEVNGESRKLIRDGQLFIERGGKTYNACGQEVR